MSNLIQGCIKKPIKVKYITFEDFITYGLAQPEVTTVDGVPWSFQFEGKSISHENDECYLIPTMEGIHNFTPADVLIIGVRGEIYPCKKDIFHETYEY